MSECARLLWSNAYLFSETGTSIDKQKNLRQVEQLLHEGVLQSIRGMLPVKSILKEYLADDGEDDVGTVAREHEEIEPVVPEVAPSETVPVPVPEPEVAPEVKEPEVAPEVKEEPEPLPLPILAEVKTPSPTIVVDTEPAKVSFTSMDTFFDSHNPSQNSIHVPMIKEDEDAGVTSLEISNDPPEAIDEYEDLEEAEALPIDEFETL